MALVIPILAVAIAGVSLLLVGISALAAARTRSMRFAFAALAFAVFAVKGLLVLTDGSGVTDTPLPENGWTVGIDAATLGFLYMAIIQG